MQHVNWLSKSRKEQLSKKISPGKPSPSTVASFQIRLLCLPLQNQEVSSTSQNECFLWVRNYLIKVGVHIDGGLEFTQVIANVDTKRFLLSWSRLYGIIKNEAEPGGLISGCADNLPLSDLSLRKRPPILSSQAGARKTLTETFHSTTSLMVRLLRIM